MFVKYLPTSIVLHLAAPYLAGTNGQQALAMAKTIWQKNKFAGTVDVLGEESTSVEQCQMYLQTYKDLIDLVSNDPLPVKNKRHQPTISFKPSMFCVTSGSGKPPGQKGLDEALERISSAVSYGFKHGVQMTLEAEDHNWTDFHLYAYFALLNAGYSNLGTVLQSRFFRTSQDIKRFDERTRVRLVTGIYKESPQIAYTANEPIKEALINYSRELLSKGAYIELASDDQAYIQKFFTDVVLPLRVTADQFETQFLLGVPRLKLQQMLTSGEYFKQLSMSAATAANRSHLEMLAESGVLVRLFLPFGSGEVASPYCKRRLVHNPNLLIYGIKNLLKIS